MCSSDLNSLSDIDNLISGWLSEINVDIESEKEPEIEITDNLNIRIIIGNDIITATMYDNATARDFISQLPMSVTLNDYASTEKIFYMPGNYSLSTVGAPSGYDPSEGEITLYAPWGNIAIFYRDYGYGSGLVPMGKIDGDGIKHFQVSGNINATFEKQ